MDGREPDRPRGWASTRPTIHDVALLSGVSKSTVSNVIRGAGRVSALTRVRVLESVDALGYRPNGLARSLVRRRANTIGVVVGDLANTFYAELVKLLEQRASRESYTVMLCNTDGRFELEAARIGALLEREVSGVVLLQYSGDPATLDPLLAAHVPVVVVSCWEERTDCVAVDDRAGMALAVEHLRLLGHRRVSYVTGPLVEEATHRARYAGYEQAMRRHGLEPRLVPWPAGHEPLLREGEPTAFVAANDLMAIRLMAALEAAGLHVPEDVSVVGFDGIELGAHSRIALTTVAQPRGELIDRGLDLLTSRIAASAGGGPPRHVRLPPTLVARRSSAAPRG